MRLLPLALVLLACSPEKKPAPAPAPPPATAGPRRVELTVTENGFEPTPVRVRKGEPLELVVTRKTDKTCALDIVVPSENIKKALPMNEPVTVAFTPARSGELKYGCAMDQMISGVLLVE